MADPLEDVLRLVAEGRLRPEEAAPIIDALATAAAAGDRARAASGRVPPDGGSPSAAPPGPPRRLRIQVRDEGRTVVDLQLPGVLAELAGTIPGIPADYADRVRNAIRNGVRGSIVDVVDEDGSGVSITID